MEECFARSGIAHLDGVTGLNHPSFREVVGDQPVDRANPNVGRNVAFLERTEHLVDEHPVANLDGDLGEKLVAAVHGVAGLEGGDGRPTLVREQRTGLVGTEVKPPVGLREVALGEDRDRTGQVDRALRQDLGDAGVGLVGRAVDLAAFEVLVDGVFLGHCEDAEDLSVPARQRDFVADRHGEVPAAGKGDGQRPEQPVLQPHVEARAAPVGLAHEALERGIRPHREHEKVRNLAARQGQFLQAPRLLERFRPLLLGKQQRIEAGVAVRGNQCRHGSSPRRETGVSRRCGRRGPSPWPTPSTPGRTWTG